MQFKRRFDTEYWRIDDPAGLYYNVHGSQQLPPPELFRARPIGHFNHQAEIDVPVETAHLKYMGAGLFGPPRPSCLGSATKWTGDCYKFGVYRYENSVVILRTDCAFYAYLDNHSSTACELWGHLVRVCDASMLWNLCYEIVFAHEAGRTAGARRICDAFLDGRLRRKRGRVSLLPQA